MSQDSYPRWKVTLFLRLEEFGKSGQVVRYARTRQLLQKTKGYQPKNVLQAVVDKKAAAQGIRRYILSAKDTDPTSNIEAGGPLEKRPQDELDFVVEGIIPWEMQFGFNGFHQADTLNFKLRMADFPFDPRLMKAVGVKAYLGAMSAADAVKAVTDPAPDTILIPDSWIDSKGRERTNERFKGWCDDVNAVWPEDDEPYVEFQCRDNSCLLIDQEFPPQFASPSLNATPLDQAIAQLLTNFPEFEGLSVEYRPAGVSPPIFNTAFADTAFRPQLGPIAHGAGGAAGGGGKLSVWDYIVDLTGSLGHMVRMEGDTIVIQTARTANSHDFPKRADDPYTPYEIPGSPGETLDVRALVYGRDLQEVKISRNYTKHGPINVQVNCYDPTNVKKVLVARYPKNIAPVGSPNPDKVINTGTGAHAHDKWQVFRVSGFSNIKALQLLAQNIYENLGRQEIKIVAKTMDLASFGGDGTDPDLLELQPGDTMKILFRRSDSDNFQTYADIQEAMGISAKAVSFLTGLGFDPAFAQSYANQFQNAGFQNTFRVKTVGIQCGDDGVNIEIEMMNYVEVRADLVGKEQKDDALKTWNEQTPGQHFELPTVEIVDNPDPIPHFDLPPVEFKE